MRWCPDEDSSGFVSSLERQKNHHGADDQPSFCSEVGTERPFAALQRLGLLSVGLLPCRQRGQEANS